VKNVKPVIDCVKDDSSALRNALYKFKTYLLTYLLTYLVR